ncbi:glycolate oxidase subunit GlcE [Acuticoccus sp. M5D2P5]|uniref:glycolate oxidase subunit GlcE n=1 Tax=Acuticoccus kalidii TaxID=2910977 RepID=UPI001F244E5C|nr:glycolate oxidase subunit GlcE [Acuticoccus kalidii]MCF3934274.1 glycolate oxidase subunit GlcE [Acuticoccus kalidii]
MGGTLTPQTEDEVREAIVWAINAGEPFEVVGHGTKRSISPPTQAAATLDVSGLDGIVAYEPEELVLTLRPGTTMAELAAEMDKKGQMFAFEPPNLAPLLGAVGEATFGGTFATNFAGPRRLTAGAVRDHMLGVHAISGRGEAFKAGGKVVKNVTGYDLSRALCGSWGTLAVATELTVKVLPRPETEVTLVLAGLTADEAVAAMSRAMGSSADVSGAAHLPAEVAPNGVTGPATALRLEGFGPSVSARLSHLQTMFAAASLSVLDEAASRALWSAVRDVTPFVGTGHAVWRISVAPTAGPEVAKAAPAGSRVMFDWAGGLLWVEAPITGDAGAAALRGAVAAAGGGHATLIRAPATLRAEVATFHPSPAPLKALSERLRNAFDPQAVLNPGRMAR